MPPTGLATLICIDLPSKLIGSEGEEDGRRKHGN